MSLKEDARNIVEAAIRRVLPENAVKAALESAGFASCRGRGGKLIIAAIGKAAWRMAKAAVDVLKGEFDGGVVITKYGHSSGPIEGLEIHEAGHPLPDENTLRGTEVLLRAVEDLNADDTVLFLISGGGSALFEKPQEGVSLSDLISVTEQLLACGADIVEINTIRKRLSSVKAGRFALRAAPAFVYSVVLSDVLGDRLDSIASGPAFPDSSTVDEAFAIVEKYALSLSPQLRKLLRHETPKALDNV